MTIFKSALRNILIGATTLCYALSTPVFADTVGTISQAVNAFQSGQATGGKVMTVDAKGPVEITDAVELPGFAFNVYDVDVTPNRLTMTLVAQLEKLKITLYDDTTFDRYYFAFDKKIAKATLSPTTDTNFSATVEIIEPGTTIKTAGAFVEGLSSEFTYENGGILVTVGQGTDLTKIKANDGALIVDF